MDAVSALDADILARAEMYRTAGLSPKKKRRLVGWGAVAASFLLVALVGVWLFLPSGVQENALIILLLDPPDTEDYVMEYHRESGYTYRAEPAVLSLRKGEFYMENDTERFYRVKGADDLTSLIGVRKDTGTMHLYRFSGFSPYMFYEEEKRPMPSLGEIWSLIYGADSAADIRRVTFEQIHVSCPYEREIPIPKISLTDKEDVARFHAAAAPLAYDGYIGSPNLVECTSTAYLDGTTPLTVQTARRVTVEFASGSTMKLELYAADGVLCLWNFANYAVSEADLAWLVEAAAIDLAWRDHGTVKEPPKGAHEGQGNEVASPEPAPPTETEKPVDVGFTD